MLNFRLLSAAAIVCVLAGCSSGPPRQPEIGEAYAGPATLKLRKELDPRSAEVATVNHGDRLGVIARRRRFVKVRTNSGKEGWTDLRQLLGTAQMAELNQLADTAAHMPSFGAATVYEALNVHTLPNRQAPSFYKVKEGELVDVVGRSLSPRVPLDAKSILPPPAPKPKPEPKKKEESSVPKPPMPAPPKLPDNWLELSKSTLPPEPEEEEKEPPKPTPVDEWSLIRLKTGRAGWVLNANLKMNIPDEVAQYSEGHRITAYFSTGTVNDGGTVRHHWLWTTSSENRQPFDFDSFRYFIWNLRKHRYETAYVERNLKGYFPVTVAPVQVSTATKTDTFPGFSVIVEEKGIRFRKTYSYQIYLVRLVSKQQIEAPAAAPAPDANVAVAQANPPAPQNKPPEPGMFARLRQNLAALKERWFGKKKSESH